MMQGTTPSAAQKRWHDLLVREIGCPCCVADGHGFNDYCSVHHIDGRTKPDAHWLVIPLCAAHHQHSPLAVHVNKTRWERLYGTQLDVMKRCAEQLLEKSRAVPERVLQLCSLECAA